MRNLDDLKSVLARIDGRGYKAYKDIQGDYAFEGGVLSVDYVQGDPFASPSKVRVRLHAGTAGLPSDLHGSRVRRTALEDFLARRVRLALRKQGSRDRGIGKSGLMLIDAGGQEVLERSAVRVSTEWVEARVEVGLPAAGRRVLGRQAAEMLCGDLPELTRGALGWTEEAEAEGRPFVECVENQEAIRSGLRERGLVAFVADGSMLPRESGVSDRPLSPEKGLAFESPQELRVSFDLPNPDSRYTDERGAVTGMGIPGGVTLIVGGGYHGKSTLLRAIERGVYPHVPGDGREYVVTRPDAVKVRAEDRRRIERVDLSALIGNLPNGQSTVAFSTEEASGSTSQAAGIIESLEAGSRLLLVDEDTAATNLMVRDARMQRLVNRESEPITPLLDRIRELYEEHGVSSLLVMGGCGDYFDVADQVILMRGYRPEEATSRAREVAEELPTRRGFGEGEPLKLPAGRVPDPRSINPLKGKGKVKIEAEGVDGIRFGNETIDLRAVEQVADASQLRAVGRALYLAAREFMGEERTLPEILDRLEKLIDAETVDRLGGFGGGKHPGNLSRPRRFEIAAALNRLRSLRIVGK